MVTKTFLKPTYLPTYASLVTVVTVVTVVIVVKVVTVVTEVTRKLIGTKQFCAPKNFFDNKLVHRQRITTTKKSHKKIQEEQKIHKKVKM